MTEKKPFSLTDFYAERTPAAGEASIPRFSVRPPEEPVRATTVGVTRAALAPWQHRRPSRAPGSGAPRLDRPVTVMTSACLAWQGTPCWTCSERCPVPGAIVLDRGRPRIDLARCDGCGECVLACPAPHNALKLAEHVSPRADVEEEKA